jgi:hypothetical protein
MICRCRKRPAAGDGRWTSGVDAHFSWAAEKWIKNHGDMSALLSHGPFEKDQSSIGLRHFHGPAVSGRSDAAGRKQRQSSRTALIQLV